MHGKPVLHGVGVGGETAVHLSRLQRFVAATPIDVSLSEQQTKSKNTNAIFIVRLQYSLLQV